MPTVPSKVAARLTAGLKRFQPILSNARTRDVNESDTALLVTDVLADVLGYDKYGEITSEYAIRGTFCDLAIKLDGKISLLVEVKAIGLDLKDPHVKQAIDYAANQGVEWVALTNGIAWRVYRVIFAKPINFDLVLELDLCELSPRKQDDIERLALLAKEGWVKAHIGEYHSQRQALSRYSLGALLLSDPVLDVLRREVRRAAGGIKVENEEIAAVLRSDVLKREVLEGEKADAARKAIARAAKRALRESTPRKQGASAEKAESGGPGEAEAPRDAGDETE